jgi:hypothetical protein
VRMILSGGLFVPTHCNRAILFNTGAMFIAQTLKIITNPEASSQFLTS